MSVLRLATARRAGLAVCLFCFVLGCRWEIVARYAIDLPEWDQWDAEAAHVLSPWYQGHLHWSDLWRAHNEHRVAVTKAVNLALTAFNGQWDQRVEAAVNAAWPALLAVGLLQLGWSQTSPRGRALLTAALAAAFAPPFAWDNIVSGFHSQQFFLIGFSLGAILWLPFSPSWSPRWWAGAACLALALASMGSGFLAAPIILVLLAARIGWRELSVRQAWPTVVLAVAAIGVGWAARVVVAGHEPLKAHTAADFWLSVLHQLQWPLPSTLATPAAAVLWLPWVTLVCLLAIGRGRSARAGGARLGGMGAWVVLQMLATAYARGAGGPFPASRYIDTLVIGAAINALALAWLLRYGELQAAARIDLIVATASWGLLFGIGGVLQLEEIMTVELREETRYHFYSVENVRRYLATGDFAYLQHAEIPYPEPHALTEKMSLPGIRDHLPASVLPPPALIPEDPHPGWVRWDSRVPQNAPPPPGRPGPVAGLAPGYPALAAAITWGSYGGHAEDWRTRFPQEPPALGWLKFEVAGDAGKDGTALELQDAASGRVLSRVVPSRPADRSWRSAYVRAPRRPFIIAAHTGPHQWLAFSGPVPMAWLSFAAWRATRQGIWLAGAAAAGAVALGCAGAFRDAARPAAPPRTT